MKVRIAETPSQLQLCHVPALLAAKPMNNGAWDRHTQWLFFETFSQVALTNLLCVTNL